MTTALYIKPGFGTTNLLQIDIFKCIESLIDKNMAKFCPECGNQMSDNAKFCMECGAKLSDYSSGGVNIGDGLVQRSQVGAASVGNVNISPIISTAKHVREKDTCPKCGFTMRKLTGKTTHEISANGKTTVLTISYENTFDESIMEAYVCPKCKYKCIYSLKKTDYDWNTHLGKDYSGNNLPCPKCGSSISIFVHKTFWRNDKYEFCEACGWKGILGETERIWKTEVPLKKALQLAGYDILC